MKDVLNTVFKLTEGIGTCVYLTKFGSHLYGTNTESSDTDYKGIFLPFKSNLILQKKCDSVQTTTGGDRSRNTKEDVDIQLWSLQYFFDLLNKGDTNAIDLLYSISASHDVRVINELKFVSRYFEEPEKFIYFVDLENTEAYVQYAYSQVSKYGLKGTRIGVLKDTIAFVEDKLAKSVVTLNDRLEVISDELYNTFKSEYCELLTTERATYLYINKKGFELHLKIKEMLDRLQTEYNKSGQRARDAANNSNIDWKAVSHAIRCLYQTEELLTTNMLHYPLKNAQELIDIKQGKRKWTNDVEDQLVDMLEHVKHIKEIKLSTERNIRIDYKKLLLSLY